MGSKEVTEPPIVIEPAAPVNAGVIWLHGLGADGHDFAGIAPQLCLPASAATRFIFPHAPFRAVTINNGYVMRAWYDIAMADRGVEQNMDQVRESVAFLARLVQQQITAGIAPERIILGGFSQGGAIAIHTGLSFPQRLAGIMSLSAPIPDIRGLLAQVPSSNSDIPIFLAHGVRDPLISLASAEANCRHLQGHGMNIEWHAYPMEHTVIPQEIADISRWLSRILQ